MIARRQLPPNESLLVIPLFSRHVALLDETEATLVAQYGPLAAKSADYEFSHTSFYAKDMGPELRKRILIFEQLRPADILPQVKRWTIRIEDVAAEPGRYPEKRPLNLDPGLLQLAKFVLATTKDRDHRIYLGDGIYAEVTLRFQGNQFEPWPWTYADYREEAIRNFLRDARNELHRRLVYNRSLGA
ncbi:MAG: DUF4416 family protein [Gemmataceae bacterium]|nr:DUF4416 family protein [Gemmataceae bacterium]